MDSRTDQLIDYLDKILLIYLIASDLIDLFRKG